MGPTLKSEETINAYLLGRVSDETMLEGIEDLLFTDEEFCSQVELAEDGLINDYVFGRLNEADAESFRTMLTDNPERRFKLDLTQGLRERAQARNVKVAENKPSFFASLASFFRQPMYAGAFAVVLIAVVGLAVYLSRRGTTDELAELRSIYQQARPTETRISKFGYAPVTQLRGAPAAGDERRLRRIENDLIEATEETPSGKTHHALGIFYLTQQDYRKAINEFESALKFADKDAQIHNDLGAAHFELSKTVAKEKRLEELARSLEAFTKATELDSNLLEALFNKSLALQELAPRQAKESWTLYLQKDPSSPWADEARKNLDRIQNEQTLFKSDEQVLADFLTAYRNHDKARAQRIHYETKGLLKGVTVPLQLSRRYLVARQRGDDVEAKESIEALTYIGNFEQEQNRDSFFFQLADFYANVDADKIERLVQAKDIFAGAQKAVFAGAQDPIGVAYKNAISEFENCRDRFARLGNECEAAIAENWAVQLLPDIGKVGESRRRISAIITTAASKQFKILLPPAYYWLGISDFRQTDFSQSNKNLKSALSVAESGSNVFEMQHAQEALALNYAQLGELEPALFYASKSLPGKELYYQSRNQWLRNLGTLVDLSLRLKFFSTCLSLSQEVLSITQEAFPGSRRVNDSLRHLIDAATAKGDFTEALKYANDSLQIALERDDSEENTGTIAQIYLLLADLKRQTSNCPEALTDYDSALEMYERLPEFAFHSYQIHRGKLFCFQQLNEQENLTAELKIVLDLSEEYRRSIREDSSRQAFFGNEHAVFDLATQNAIIMRDSRRAFDFVEVSKARSLLDFIESAKPIAEVEKTFGRVARPLSLAAIQTRLPSEVQVVQYAVLPDRLAIWIVSKTRFDLVEKRITAAELENKVDAYQLLVEGKGPLADIRQAGQELYEILIPEGLAGDKQLCLVPDKALHQLAFASLVSGAGKYLLEDYSLFYAPSASVLVLATEDARRKDLGRNESLLSIGNPDFEREENVNLPDLQGAEAEAKAITAGYQKPLALLGDEATKDKFLQNFTRVEVVHFAGHFVANRQSPGNSKLLFADAELRSSELGDYKLPKAKLVVLSACETGFERYDKSEGAIGIARTLLALGAPVVVASQWKVDSEPTKHLMIAFHRNRKEKQMTSAESLQQAQLEVLSSEKTRAPFYWAAFSLFGGYASY